MKFFYGTSKRIEELPLKGDLAPRCLEGLPPGCQSTVEEILDTASQVWDSWSGQEVQERWRHSHEGGVHPFEVTDHLGQIAAEVRQAMTDVEEDILVGLTMELLEFGETQRTKLSSRARPIISGILVGARFNESRAAT